MSTYAKIGNFGTNMRKNQSINSDYVYTELGDPFLHGNTFNPMGRESRRLMIDKCALSWTEDCDHFSRPWIRDYLIDQKDGTITTSQGDLIKQAAIRRFCVPLDCRSTQQLVDPTTIGSPSYTVFNTPCQMECVVDPQTIDLDPLMNRVLERPLDNAMLLMNICNTAKRKGVDLTGTKVGGACRILGIM